MGTDHSLEPSLEARLRRVEDRLELDQLVNRYCIAVDDTHWVNLASLYAENAELGPARGRGAVVEAIRAVRETYGRTVHSPLGFVVDFDGPDEAHGLATARGELDIQGQLVICHIRYYDTYVREEGSWLFLKRNLRFLYALRWDDMGVALVATDPVRWPGIDATAPDF